MAPPAASERITNTAVRGVEFRGVHDAYRCREEGIKSEPVARARSATAATIGSSSQLRETNLPLLPARSSPDRSSPHRLPPLPRRRLRLCTSTEGSAPIRRTTPAPDDRGAASDRRRCSENIHFIPPCPPPLPLYQPHYIPAIEQASSRNR
ncbi:hypothetical protein HPB50_000269 [Hyalomma asiaticum]|uniref:Uncharacterized protein n=1 Tax=Hyalomma asiaticum TaxID=266040 RepID=A0ACB7S8F9_HYAAI|nr:hypothetical protein HPB50_000269 [Hyalomma asiaticum]